MPVQANTLDTVAGCREVEAAWALVVAATTITAPPLSHEIILRLLFFRTMAHSCHRKCLLKCAALCMYFILYHPASILTSRP
jgi:hypothetical protein